MNFRLIDLKDKILIKILSYRVFGLKLSNNAILEVGEEDPSLFVDIFASIDSIEASWEG